MDRSENLRRPHATLAHQTKRPRWIKPFVAVTGVTTTLVLGAALALLFAPKDGSWPFVKSGPLQTGRSQASNARSSPQASAPADPKQPSFVLPNLAPAPNVSVIDAAKMVDKAKGARKSRADADEQMPTLVIDKVIRVGAAGSVPFRLSFSASGALPMQSNITVGGLPSGVALSAGQRGGAGEWRLVPDDLEGLKLVADADTAGSNDLVVKLAAPDGRVASEAHSVLIISRTEEPTATSRSSARSETVTPAMIKELLQHGRDLQRVGYIAGARLFYRRAADSGSAEGAQALGDTYEPATLRKLGVRGLEPDQDAARKWHDIARALEKAPNAPP